MLVPAVPIPRERYTLFSRFCVRTTSRVIIEYVRASSRSSANRVGALNTGVAITPSPFFEAQVTRPRDPLHRIDQCLPVRLDNLRAESASTRPHHCNRATRRMGIQTDVSVHGIPPSLLDRALPPPPVAATASTKL